MARKFPVVASALWIAAVSLAAVSLAAVSLAAIQPPAVAAQSPPIATSPILHHDVIDVKEKKLLLKLRGWNEKDGDRPDEVTAVSLFEFPTGTVGEVRAQFTRDSPPRCLSWHGVLRDRNGTVVSSAVEHVVPDAYPLLTKPLPPDAYPPLAPFAYVVTHLGLGKAQPRASFQVILPNGSLIQMDLWVEGREMVSVPAGKFDAYRVSMRANAESVFPNLARFLIPLVSLFIPTQTVWLTAQAPQMLIKFTGQTGPPGSPQLSMELTGIGDK
jgi:hypothetical protein